MDELKSLAYGTTRCAKVLDISRPTLYKLMQEDSSFPRFKLGARTLIPVHALERWVEAQAGKEGTA